MIKLLTSSTEDTKIIGKRLAPHLKNGDVIILLGDLGAGKTMFVSGVLSYFGKENETSSPTFTIVNEHNLTTKLNLYHFDVYRFDFEDEFLAIGGEEFFEKGICMIEWAEKIKSYLPNEYLKVNITKDVENENTRIIELIPVGARYQTLLSNAFNE